MRERAREERTGDAGRAEDAARTPTSGPAEWALAMQRSAGNRATAAALPTRPVPTAGAVLARTPAQELVQQHTGMMGATLDEIGLANALVARLPGDPAFVDEVLDAVDWMNRDDIAYEIAINSTDPMLRTLAASPAGDKLIRRLAIEMQGGTTVEAEEAEVERLLQIVSAVRNAPGAEDGGGGGAIAVEVITFTSGTRGSTSWAGSWAGSSARAPAGTPRSWSAALSTASRTAGRPG